MSNMHSLLNYKITTLVFVIATIAIAPSLTYVVLNLSSLGIGNLISMIISLFTFSVVYRKLSKVILFYSVLILLVTLFFSIGGLLDKPIKILGSLVALSLMMLSANIMSKYLINMTNGEVYSSINYLIILFLALGIVGVLVPFNFLGYESFPKSIFTFYEPSHYAITVGPIFVASMIILKKNRSLICFLFLFISLSSQNLTMLVYWAIGTWLAIENKKVKLVFSVIVISFIAFFYTYFSSSLVYYTDRIDISEDSSNLSALVYLQGWHEISKSLYDSFGFGLGFQQAGSNEPGEISERIYELAGIYKNRQDAAFLSAKIIIEFGVVGLIIICLFLKSFITTFKNVYSLDRNVDKFIAGVVLSIFVEMFFRGQGYFTLGTYLLFVSVNYKILKSRVVL
ncbi:hypothetical protein LNL84_17595 [Vibrio sp. ZSDZ34]|uniref:Uncharacterized protein n=1 Tax=Vibrio gelatinilyticus TaxID=2893468 RepID=A0A9X2AXP0_9VIBR|nr:hypothetical protein [Vibrio gelatinilyticus]MCJ2378626.1 hypothetical protein [Vibrio gelatinilyticus]